jgi:hypothetical protein
MLWQDFYNMGLNIGTFFVTSDFKRFAGKASHVLLTVLYVSIL